MLYNSFEFMVLFGLMAALYYVIPRQYQWKYLLLVSYGYYITFGVKYAAFLLISTVTTYGTARLMEKTETQKKQLLIVCTAVNLGLLGAFKYLGWILQSAQTALDNLGVQALLPVPAWIAPAGISFYTFRVVSYLADVYKGKISVEQNVGKYALYVSFFPQIVSGPIERAYDFLSQLEKGYRFEYETVKRGFVFFLAGLVKKLVFADRFAILVNQVFDHVQDYGAWSYIIAMFFYTFQIYFDFSGYTDLAMGCTQMLGMKSAVNFNRPYFADTIADFWRRWHMSLSSWFKDYVYIPLGGNRKGRLRWTVNIMIVFLLSGIWHGANWTFVIWGGLHGLYQVAGRFTLNARNALWNKAGITEDAWLRKIWKRVFTFLCVNYAWMFFRANSIADAFHITKTLFMLKDQNFALGNLGMGMKDFALSIVLIAVFMILEMFQENCSLYEKLQEQKLPVRWAVYLGMVFLCVLFGFYGSLSTNSFVYFQF